MVNVDSKVAQIYILQMEILNKAKNKSAIYLQICILFSVALMAGIGTNTLRSAPLPLVQDWSTDAQLTTEDGHTMALGLDQAIVFYENDSTLFIDARDVLKFHEGHIKGALNLPWHNVQEQFMAVAPQIDPDALVITYCDGKTCTLSHDLAFFLKEMGFNVKVMSEGWEAWLNADMPVESTKGSDENA